ncbi:MAG: T9SS type A sorting domain-containing protein [Rhodothermales bacterium]
MSRLLALLVLFAAAPALGQPALLQTLTDPNPTPGSQFGSAVALSGDYIVVGEPGEAGAIGRAFVFVREAGADTWTLDEQLVPSSLETGGEFDPAFGAATDFDGTEVLIGAPYESEGEINSGAAYVFRRDDAMGDWLDVAKLKAPTPALEEQFGAAVAISDATAAVGAFANDAAGDEAGAVFLYTRDASGAWSFAQQLTAADAGPGERFGFSVALRGDVLVVGLFNEIVPDSPGAAYVFERDGDGTWQQVQKLSPDAVEPNDRFGFDVATDGTAIFVGAPLSTPNEQGAAYVFERTGAGATPWVQAFRLISVAPQDNAQFGTSVSVEGDRAAVGAPLDGTDVAAGAVYTFDRENGVWAPENRLSVAGLEETALFGNDVALRDGLTVVGSPDADGDAEDTGAAFVFALTTTAAEDDTAPDAFGLGVPFPNPVRSIATIPYTLDDAGDVALTAFDVLGREVAVLDAGRRPAGSGSVTWATRGLPAGVYFVRLTDGERTATRKVLVIR